MKKIFLTALIALASVLPAHAQNEKPLRFDFGFNPISYLHQGDKDLWGGSLSLAMRHSDHLSYLFDLTIHQTRDDLKYTTSAYRFGMRYYANSWGKFTPFGEAMAGGANLGAVTVNLGSISTITKGSNGFAFGAGGGLDYKIKPWLSWRTLQVDYSLIHSGGNTSNGVRIHTGGSFRFGH